MKGNEHQDWQAESEAKTILTKLGIYVFDESTEHLSGGQKKRIALARAWWNQRRFLYWMNQQII